MTISAVSAEINDSAVESMGDDMVIEGDRSRHESLQASLEQLPSDDKIWDAENSTSVKPQKQNFEIEFYDDYHIYGETNIIGFVMANDIENNVSVEIDAKAYGYGICDIDDPYIWVWGGDAQTQKGYMVKFSDLSPGGHSVTIVYSGDTKYSQNRLDKTITVHDDGQEITKLSSKMSVANVVSYYSSGKYLVAALKDENGNPSKMPRLRF